MSHRKNSDNPRKGYHGRRVNHRPLPYSFLIVCEGSKTEPEYFRSFPIDYTRVSITLEPKGGAPKNIVEKAAQLRRKAAQDGEPYDEIWCVFDRDQVPEEGFNKALQDAQKRQFKVAYTNEAFELWYLLHFDFHNTGIDRRTYERRLAEKLGVTYRKNDPGMYDMLMDRQPTAIRYAEKLLKQYDPCDPARDNPSTTVHVLVQRLNEFLRPSRHFPPQ